MSILWAAREKCLCILFAKNGENVKNHGKNGNSERMAIGAPPWKFFFDESGAVLRGGSMAAACECVCKNSPNFLYSHLIFIHGVVWERVRERSNL